MEDSEEDSELVRRLSVTYSVILVRVIEPMMAECAWAAPCVLFGLVRDGAQRRGGRYRGASALGALSEERLAERIG